jgi:hypothetical protein
MFTATLQSSKEVVIFEFELSFRCSHFNLNHQSFPGAKAAGM